MILAFAAKTAIVSAVADGACMKTVVKLLGMVAFVAAMALPAAAQQGWTFGGLVFKEQAGWCTTHLDDSMEIRRCGTDFPYLAVSTAAPPPSAGEVPYNVATIASGGAATMESADGPGIFAELMEPIYGKCSGDTLDVLRNPVPGVAGFTIVGTFVCGKEEAIPAPIDFRNFSGFVNDTAGGVWVVSYDYPLEELNAEDIALIQSVAGTIEGK